MPACLSPSSMVKRLIKNVNKVNVTEKLPCHAYTQLRRTTYPVVLITTQALKTVIADY